MKTERVKITGKDVSRVAFALIACNSHFEYDCGELFMFSSSVEKVTAFLANNSFKGDVKIELVTV